MNQHLLETKKRSIIHYQEECLKLKLAIEATKSTQEDLIKDLKEFFPFESGDIILTKKDGYILRISNCSHVIFNEKENSFSFYIKYFLPDGYRFENSERGDRFTFDDVKEFKKIN